MSLFDDTPRKAAMYLRISQDREMDGLAIDRQREDCERMALLKRWEIVATYVDQSISAYSRTALREQYDLMVADFEAGLFDAIICWDLDRLTRQPRQLEDWIDAARFRGLALVTANGEADLTTSTGRTFARMKAAVAAQEMEMKSIRQSRAQLQRATLGRPPKGMRPLGYTVQGGVIEDEAATVRAIFAAFTRTEDPESLRSLARALSGDPGTKVEGIAQRPKHTHVVSIEREAARKERLLKDNKPYVFDPKKIKADGPWNPSTVSGILHNPRYAGLSTYTPKVQHADGNRRRTWKAQILRDDEGKSIRGLWTAIVDEETWWKAQAILDDRQRVTNTTGSTKRKHLGSGLYRCGVVVEVDGSICGHKVTGGPRGYRCAKHVKPVEAPGEEPMTSLVRSGPAIDQYVTDIIVKRLAKEDVLKKVPMPSRTEATNRIEAEISKRRASIIEAELEHARGEIRGSDLNARRSFAEGEIARLESERLLSGRSNVLRPILGADDPAEAFLDGPLELRRQVIDLLVTVTLYPQPRGRKGFDE
ncbi:MAG: recombinase family protein, partial [Propionibacteriaceae bacterium]|nr:recombinase family protein [Propionibacteriaceae bacterium]